MTTLYDLIRKECKCNFDEQEMKLIADNYESKIKEYIPGFDISNLVVFFSFEDESGKNVSPHEYGIKCYVKYFHILPNRNFYKDDRLNNDGEVGLSFRENFDTYNFRIHNKNHGVFVDLRISNLPDEKENYVYIYNYENDIYERNRKLIIKEKHNIKDFNEFIGYVNKFMENIIFI